MKKHILASLIGLASGVAMAASGTPCTGGAGQAATVPAGAAGTNFNLQAINFRCSNNVFLSWQDSATVMAVGTGSAKGKTAYKGNSSGGAVTRSADCDASGCTQANATTAAGGGYSDATSTSTSTTSNP